MLLVLAASGRAQSLSDRSVYLNQKDTQHDPDLQEASTDAGGHVYKGMLKDLNSGSSTWEVVPTSGTWPNPVDYSSIDVTTSGLFQWDGSAASETAALYDELNRPGNPYSVTYQVRRFRLHGASGVFMFPTDGFSEDESIHVLIENPGTGSDLHTDAYTGTIPAAIGKIALLPSVSGRNVETDRFVVVRISGGPGPQALLARLQHTLAVRKAIETVIAPEYGFEPNRYFLTGGSFGTAPSYVLQLVYPNLFHGTVGVGSSAVCTQALFGYESLFRFGIGNVGTRESTGGNASEIFTSGQWYYDQLTKILRENTVNQGSGTGGLENMSLLGRLQHRLNGGSWTGPILTRPIFVSGGDEDAIAWLHPFRRELEDIAAATVGSGTYGDFFKILQVPFHEHASGREPDTIHLNPGTYFTGVPNGYTTVDWLVERSVYVDTLGFTQAALPWDDGTPEPNVEAEYRFHEATLEAPPQNPTNNGLNVTTLWPDGGSGEGFVGTGIEPGLCDNLHVGDLDGNGSTDLELMYGEASGFVHLYDIVADGQSWKLERKWRSPDFGGAVTGLSVGTFAKPASEGGGTETGAVAITASGQVWTIRTSLSTPVAYHLSNWDFALGGERENPLVEVGEYADSTTVVYFMGTSYKARSSSPPTDGLPNECQLSRVVFSDLTQLSSSATLYQEPCDVLNSLEWNGEELLATTSRGHLLIIEDGVTDFTLKTRNNENFGDYQLMAPRACLTLNIPSTVYLLAGQATIDRESVYNPPLRNVTLIRSNGDLDTHSKTVSVLPNGVGNVNFNCGAVIVQSGAYARVALGGDAVYFYDIEPNLGTGTNIHVLNQVDIASTSADAWSARLHADTGDTSFPHLKETVLSLEAFEIVSGEGDIYLAGTTSRGIVFLWDVPDGTSDSLSQKPTVVDQLEPFVGNWGLKALDKAVPSTNGHGCDTSKKYTLNVLPIFSYSRDFDEEPSLVDREENGTVYIKLDALNGDILCERQREDYARKFNPDRRDLSGSTSTNQLVSDVFANSDPLSLDTHVFIETAAVGELVTSGQWDLAFRFQTMPLDGALRVELDYLNSTTVLPFPSSGTYMKDDRYFTAAEQWGTVVAIGNITSHDGDEIVLATNGGRFVILNESGELAKSWGTDPSSPTGDFGFKYTGLALYDVDGDGYDEIFAVGAIFTDPDPNSTISPTDNASRLLFWDSNGSANVIQGQPQLVDFLEPGCMGLWVGPRIGECKMIGNVDLIVGKSQTFEVFAVSMSAGLTLTSRFESAGLGALPGAFNAIEVLSMRASSLGPQFHGIFVGTTGYVYGFRGPNIVCTH